MKKIIPLFPLNTVLFPGMWLPLRVFEERYKSMVADCKTQGGVFGIALIRTGVEVGGPAEPYPVGTLARIQKITPLEGGQMYLQTQGVQRFRLLRTIAGQKPYLLGEVELLDDDRPRYNLPAAQEILQLYEKYLTLLRSLGGQIANISLERPDSNFLSWLVAATLMIGPSERQELLQIDRTEERLGREAVLLKEHIRMLEMRKSNRSLPFSRN